MQRDMRTVPTLLCWLAVCSSCGVGEQQGCRSFCGCWEPTTLERSGRVFDASTGAPVPDVVVTCAGEDAGLATSDGEGHYSFSRTTQASPGCGYEACNTLRFEAPSGDYASASMSAAQLAEADGGVSLEPH